MATCGAGWRAPVAQQERHQAAKLGRSASVAHRRSAAPQQRPSSTPSSSPVGDAASGGGG
eukprot:4960780-Prymnesium_polylepis.1